MTLDDFPRVAREALASIDSLLSGWFPNGVVEAREFCIGSRDGEAGKSMRICILGDNIGCWSDFSAGDAGGDLISLYAYIHNISQGKACAALAKELGMELTDDGQGRSKGKPALVKPQPKKVTSSAPASEGVHGTPSDKKKKAPWMPILPVPENAGGWPLAHPVRGRPEASWQYRDQDGQLLGLIYRFKTSDGGKEVLPCVYAHNPEYERSEWRWISFPEPRPLYLHGAMRPELPVLVVEGEKCADAAFEVLWQHYDVVSWPGGGKAAKKAFWAELKGRTVILWPDADAKVYKASHAQAGELMAEAEQPGMSAMNKIAEILRELECIIHTVDIPQPGEKPDGWDVFDMIADGATSEEVLTLSQKWRPDAQADVQVKENSAGNAVPDDDVPDWVSEPADGVSTPPAASASKWTRKQIRNAMIAGAKSGDVRGCRENVYLALQRDQSLVGLVALDQFSMLQVKRRNPPWPSEQGEWTESDDFHLGVYLANYYDLLIANIGDIEKAVAQVARENGFNPVVELFNSCLGKWDGQERVKDAFSTYWGAQPSDYLRTISRMFFVGLAQRAFVPGVKHDYAPVFEGGQGEGKSTALAVLGGEWFADTPFQMGNKDGYLAIQGVLIYEIAELEQFNRSEVTAVKAFMSSQKDRYREPYGRRMKNQLRRTVFAATTNEGQYFKDPTGNRRFWPVATGRLDLEALRRDREQLLGEAVHLMRDGAKWYPTRDEQTRLITPMQENRDIPDEWAGRIWEYCEGVDSDGQPTAAGPRMRVTGRELITKGLHIEVGKISQAKTETGRISNIMRKMGWRKERETSGAREWYYVRPIDEEMPVESVEVVVLSEADYDLPI